MKRIFLITLLTLFTIAGFSQSNGTLKFLDIPVDGTEAQFVAKLKNKGFSYSSETGTYKGQFNGSMVDVYIHTNHNIIDRVVVVFPERDEEGIKVEFNNLLSQFWGNKKYIDLMFNDEIPKEEDISYEITVKNKAYEAVFHYFDPNRDQMSLLDEFLEYFSDYLSTDQIADLKNNIKDAIDLPKEDLRDFFDDMEELIYFISKQYPDEETQAMIYNSLMSSMGFMSDGHVWFKIMEDYGYYYIGLYYDNLHNRPHGEDL